MNRVDNGLQRLLTLIQLELSVFKAERWILLSGLAFICILTAEIFLTARTHNEFRASAETARAAARENWLNLGDRDPHGAAHHGTYLFKPVPELSVFDPGLIPYQGTTIRAEAHVRHRVTNRPAENDVNVMRNALTTPAELIQGVLPMLLILLGCGSIARERQQRTLSLIRSQGVSWTTIVFGKICALMLVALGLAIPYLGSLIVIIISSLSFPGSDGVWMRGVLLGMGVIAYLACWCCFVVAVSARTRSEQMALTVLLLFWGVTTFCIPALTTNLVALTNPLPSQEDVRKWSQDKMYGNEETGNIFRKIRVDFKKEMLAKYQVESTSDLPFNFDGMMMLESEKVTDAFFLEDANRLASLQKPFEKTIDIASFLSPYLATHRLTMALTGTDEWHHEQFDNAAESYRQYLVKVVNQADAQKDGPEATRGEALWKSVREFEYRSPAVSDVVPALWRPLLILAIWSTVSLALAVNSYRVSP